MAVLLSDPTVTSATPGVLVKGIVDPGGAGTLTVVTGAFAGNRISDQIDTSYIVNGAEAYWSFFAA